MTKPLAIIPVYMSQPSHLALLKTCIKTLLETADAEILLVDDVSPLQNAMDILKRVCVEFGLDPLNSLVQKQQNSGFSRTVNVGLRLAHHEQRPAVLVNMDIQFIKQGWLEAALDDPADVVGAKLLYPNMFIQHGGIYFSLLHQYFDHLFKFAPANLPEACMRWEVPVTGALQIIKPHVFDKIGFYDEEYRLSYEDVDFCLRTIWGGLTCAMNPNVVAIHHEGMVRQKAQTPKMAQWIQQSNARLAIKFQDRNFLPFLNPIDRSDDSPVWTSVGGGVKHPTHTIKSAS